MVQLPNAINGYMQHAYNRIRCTYMKFEIRLSKLREASSNDTSDDNLKITMFSLSLGNLHATYFHPISSVVPLLNIQHSYHECESCSNHMRIMFEFISRRWVYWVAINVGPTANAVSSLAFVFDDRVVRMNVSEIRNVLSWSGGHGFKPWSGQTWGV